MSHRPISTVLFFVALFAGGPARAAAPVPEIAELPGPMVIAGGRDVPDDVRDAFFALAGKDKAKIVVIPTAIASADNPKTADETLKLWQDLQPESVVLLHTRDRKTADDPAFVKPLAEATAVWFTHGHPDRLVSAYRGTLVEKELKKLQARGGVIGGTGAGAMVLTDLVIVRTAEAPKTEPGLGLLPGFVIERGLDGRFEGAISANPAHVGLAIPDGTALVIRGRSMRVIGESAVTVCLAKGAGRPAKADEAKAGTLLDLFQLRRAAANRAAADPFPPAKPHEPVVEEGSLVIIGGGGTTPEIMNTFFERAGGKDALIVVIPTADEGNIPEDPGDAKYLRKWGATNVKVLHTRDRKRADDPAFSEVLLKAGGGWFGGGRQWRFVDAYEGTLTEKRFHTVLARGGVIGGSSAGASIQSEYMPRGHPLGNTVMAAEGYERGFGFLPGVAVDQHFFARKRPRDMTGLMKLYPQYLGIGIDEATAIVVSGSTAEVIGKSKVAFYDTRKQSDGEKDYEELTAGEKYDLKKRERIKADGQ
ncbi:MAG TPA: cyanophycinase [Gemmataceae bacterium]|nr:cyanophycinase [Gemmataceae bacterium]